jgi:hypothetical protein
MAFLAILGTGIAVDGAIRYKMEWVEELEWGYLLGKKQYID